MSRSVEQLELWLAFELLFSEGEEELLRLALADESGETMVALIFRHVSEKEIDERDALLFQDFLAVVLGAIHAYLARADVISHGELLLAVKRRVQARPVIREFFTLQECMELVEAIEKGRDASLVLSDLLTGAYLLFSSFEDLVPNFKPARNLLLLAKLYESE